MLSRRALTFGFGRLVTAAILPISISVGSAFASPLVKAPSPNVDGTTGGIGVPQGWGWNNEGQLGDGTTANRTSPVSPNLSGAISIAGGNNHTLVAKSDGTAWAWGRGQEGELGNGTLTDSSTPIQVLGPGGSGYLTGVTSVAAGRYHSLAVMSDGTVWTWGRNSDGELGNGTTTASSTPVQAIGLTGVIAVAGGQFHSLALKSDGTVWAWGYNVNGQLGDGTRTSRSTPVQVVGPSGVVAIAAGQSHSVALESDGTVWAWGLNSDGQLGDGTTTQRLTPIQVTGLSQVSAIGAGGWHTLAVKSDGTAWGWGRDSDGQVGYGAKTNRAVTTPQQVVGPGGSGYFSGASTIAGGLAHSLILKSDGTVWAWGRNREGEIGNGKASPTDQLSPSEVEGPGGSGFLSGMDLVAAGWYHSLALATGAP